jgi:predicted mannosyl-3-phosphoglycerate phosphatase (HAD superfamily)
MSAATYLISSCKGLPPTRTMLMVADDPNNLPMEFLKSFNRVVVAFNNDEQGNFAARDFQRINYSKKNNRQVFSRMIIILRGGEKGLPRATPFLPLIYA